jgi:UDP-N-acetylmuramate-alanine ligase
VAGREEKTIRNKISSEKLVKAVNKKNVIYLKTDDILGYIKNNLPKNAVLIIMGAGDIYKLVDIIRLTEISKRKRIK